METKHPSVNHIVFKSYYVPFHTFIIRKKWFTNLALEVAGLC